MSEYTLGSSPGSESRKPPCSSARLRDQRLRGGTSDLSSAGVFHGMHSARRKESPHVRISQTLGEPAQAAVEEVGAKCLYLELLVFGIGLIRRRQRDLVCALPCVR